LAGAGGNDLRNITYNILKKLFTNALAATLNMEGRSRLGQETKSGFKHIKSSFEVFHGKSLLIEKF